MLDDILCRHPDIILPPDPEFREEYDTRVRIGEKVAAESSVALVAICRNAMPFLPLTLQNSISPLRKKFGRSSMFIYENDSSDGTAEFLKQNSQDFELLSETHSRPHLNMTKAAERTIALAEYRNTCRRWVAENHPEVDYVVVFDTDPWGGFSVDGVMTTLSYLAEREYQNASGMGSYSYCVWGQPVWPQPTRCHYDAWAARLNHWTEHEMLWFHLWHPPVGSRPVRMNSCFGQLAVYRTPNFLEGEYVGGDCEHVGHWKTAGGDCYLNPSQRAVSFWHLEPQ